MNDTLTEHYDTGWCPQWLPLMLVVECIVILIAVIAIVLNSLILLGIIYYGRRFPMTRFRGVRRSLNFGHPRFSSTHLKGLSRQYSLHSRIRQRRISPSRTYSPRADGVFRKQKLTRSPSCPETLLSKTIRPAHAANGIHFSECRIPVNRPQASSFFTKSRRHLTTTLRLVCCLVIADLINAATTVSTVLLSMDYSGRNEGKVSIHNQTSTSNREYVGPCIRLLLATLRHSAYNAGLLSVTGIAADIYLGLLHPMRYPALAETRRVTKCLIVLWILSIVLGSNQLYIPAILYSMDNSLNATVQEQSLLTMHVLPPSEPCYSKRGYTHPVSFYCFRQGAGNVFRTGFLTMVLLFFAFCFVNVVYVVVHIQLPKRPCKYKHSSTILTSPMRSASLPVINNVQAIAVDLNGAQERSARISGALKWRSSKGFVRSLIATRRVLGLFAVTFLPGIIAEIYSMYAVRHRHEIDTSSTNSLRMFLITSQEILANLPVCCAALNPILYGLRMPDVRLGLRNLRDKLSAAMAKCKPQRNGLQKMMRRSAVTPFWMARSPYLNQNAKSTGRGGYTRGLPSRPSRLLSPMTPIISSRSQTFTPYSKPDVASTYTAQENGNSSVIHATTHAVVDFRA